MKTVLITLGILIGLILVIGLIFGGFYTGNYNRFVTMDEQVNAQWSQVENALQRRADLIPNLVATVKGYAKHESDIFTHIADARSQLAGAKTIPEKAQASANMESALSRLLVVVENYPDLKANEQFTGLRDELAGTENRLAVERKRYNDVVQVYNAQIRQFPANFVAGMMGLRPKEYFKASEGAKEAPKVDFN